MNIFTLKVVNFDKAIDVARSCGTLFSEDVDASKLVVRAENEDQARTVAANFDHYGNVKIGASPWWLEKTATTCEDAIDVGAQAEVLLWR